MGDRECTCEDCRICVEWYIDQSNALQSRVKELEAEKETWGNEYNAVIILKEENDRLRKDLTVAESDRDTFKRYAARMEPLVDAAMEIAVKEVNGYDPVKLLENSVECLKLYGGFQNCYAINHILQARKNIVEALRELGVRA